MCGIIGYIGNEKASPILMEGLRKQSYRGYDSSGIVVLEKSGDVVVIKSVGKLDKLEEKLKDTSIAGTIGLGHSRWATHGEATEKNAHPHSDCDSNIFVVHNGIIENYRELKKHLKEKGHTFSSETDTEVLPHLIENFFKGNLEDAVREALLLVKGAYGLVVISKKDPEKIVAARLSSPLVISVNGKGGFVASDPAALVAYSKKMVFLDDKEIAVITAKDFKVTDLMNNKKEKEEIELEWSTEEAQKGGYDHFMLKEIFEQPQAIEDALRGRLFHKDGKAKLGGLEPEKETLKNMNRLIISAMGTAYLAGAIGEYMIEEYAEIPAELENAAEFRYRNPIIDKNTGFLAISQSGETADTLAALREAKKKGAHTIGIINVIGSTLAREVDEGIYNHAGPEIGVASTKAFSSQVVILALLSLFLGRERGLSLTQGKKIILALEELPRLANKVLEQNSNIETLSEKYKDYDNFFFIGRKYSYPIAMEGALKLKEISYVHAEGYEAGEMKHGPIALIDKDFPTVAICPSDSVYEKTLSNIQEIKARKGRVIAIATEGNKDIKEIVDDVIYIPKTMEMLTPILSVIPLQLFAYYIGVKKGYDVDKPRNLAKSVTVE